MKQDNSHLLVGLGLLFAWFVAAGALLAYAHHVH